jgi:hypothetical protein
VPDPDEIRAQLANAPGVVYLRRTLAEPGVMKVLWHC